LEKWERKIEKERQKWRERNGDRMGRESRTWDFHLRENLPGFFYHDEAAWGEIRERQKEEIIIFDDPMMTIFNRPHALFWSARGWASRMVWAKSFSAPHPAIRHRATNFDNEETPRKKKKKKG
jgi:hypothetical protein